jgi:hypothetical protein
MVLKENSKVKRNKMIDDPAALKESVLNCFNTVFGPDFVSEENLNRPLNSRNIYSYDFGYGDLFFRPVFNRVAPYEMLHDWYVYAPANVTTETRELLYQNSTTYDDYMLSCIFISAIKTGYSIRVKPIVNGFILAPVIQAHMWWVERMFIELVPVDKILFALTRDVVIHTEKEYESFRDDIRDFPVAWLNETYALTIHTSY